jgi:DNA-binding NarL/FixJ family response regulator
MLKTLIVENNTDFRHLLREILCNHFPSIIIAEATSNMEALKKIKLLSPHLIFMDVKLMNGNSLPFVKKIKITHPEIIIVVLTLYNIPEYRDAALQSGATYFLTKNSLTSNIIVELVESISSTINRLDSRSSAAQQFIAIKSGCSED